MAKKQKTVIEQLEDVRKRVKIIEDTLSSMRTSLSKFIKDSSPELSQSFKGKPATVSAVEMGQSAINQANYTEHGVMVGQKAWVAFSGDDDDPTAVHLVSVTAYKRAERVLSIVFDADGAEADIDIERAFPHSQSGKEAAQAIVDTLLKEERDKEARQAQLLVLAVEGEVTLKKLLEMDHRSLVALAGIVGLNPFTDLKGVKGDDRAKKVLSGLKSFRKKKQWTKEALAEAKKTISAWEKDQEPEEDDIARAKAIAAKRAVKKEEPSSDDKPPAKPSIGDLVANGSAWFRLVSEGSIRGMFIGEMVGNTSVRQSFAALKFQRFSASKKTPIWSP